MLFVERKWILLLLCCSCSAVVCSRCRFKWWVYKPHMLSTYEIASSSNQRSLQKIKSFHHTIFYLRVGNKNRCKYLHHYDEEESDYITISCKNLHQMCITKLCQIESHYLGLRAVIGSTCHMVPTFLLKHRCCWPEVRFELNIIPNKTFCLCLFIKSTVLQLSPAV